MNERLQRYREYIARLDAAANPLHAIKRKFYVPRSGRSIAEVLKGRVELRPAATHLVFGGTGSGKTTELYIAKEGLRQLSDATVIYGDVSRNIDLSSITPQSLLVLAGILIGAHVDKTLPSTSMAFNFFKGVALGRPVPVEDEDEDPGDGRRYVWEPGMLQLSNPLSSSEYVKQLKVLNDALRAKTPHVVLLLDGLDRMVDLEAFEKLVVEAVAALSSLSIGVVMVGPLKLLYGKQRPIADHFDYQYPISWVDPEEPEGRDFLLRVLRARASADILPDEAAGRVVELSGGSLRDLIGIARNAGEEAYLAGEDRIAGAHVEAAADAFGRALMLGLLPDDLKTLQRVRTEGTFIPTSDAELALLMTSRVLEYRNGRVRYAVHPTIRQLLAQLEEP